MEIGTIQHCYSTRYGHNSYLKLKRKYMILSLKLRLWN